MKTLTIFLFATILFLSSCKSEQAADNAPNANEKLIREYFELFNKHDWDKMAAMYADTADFKDPSFGVEMVKQSRAETSKKYAELAQVFPDLKDSVVSIYHAGDKNVVVEFVSTGTGPDSMKLDLPICTIFTIENGLITKDFTYYDNQP
jgi:steroid delta-isomerase-like uncharacterized protein